MGFRPGFFVRPPLRPAWTASCLETEQRVLTGRSSVEGRLKSRGEPVRQGGDGRSCWATAQAILADIVATVTQVLLARSVRAVGARLRVLAPGLLLCASLIGCGSSTRHQTRGAWCPRMTLLTATATMRYPRNTPGRVDIINAQYQRQILRVCPGVVSVGVSDAAIIRGEQEGKRHFPPASKLHQPVIAVGVRAKRYLPTTPLFLKGVPLLFQVTAIPHLLSSAGAQRSQPPRYHHPVWGPEQQVAPPVRASRLSAAATPRSHCPSQFAILSGTRAALEVLRPSGSASVATAI